MGLRRGLFLGVLVGAIGALTGRAASKDEASASRMREAREAARQGMREAEERMRVRLNRARHTGKVEDD